MTYAEALQELRRIADSYCSSYLYEVPEPYILMHRAGTQDDPHPEVDYVWCPYTGALAMCVDDEADPVRILERGETGSLRVASNRAQTEEEPG